MKYLVILAIFAGLVIALGFGLGNDLLAGSLCENHVRIYAADDSGDNPLAQSIYDPCDGDLLWTFSFHRTDVGEPHQNIITYRIREGTTTLVFFRDAHSWFYPPNDDYIISGVQGSIPHRDQHIFELLRSWGELGLFEEIEGIADYRAGTPH